MEFYAPTFLVAECSFGSATGIFWACSIIPKTVITTLVEVQCQILTFFPRTASSATKFVACGAIGSPWSGTADKVMDLPPSSRTGHSMVLDFAEQNHLPYIEVDSNSWEDAGTQQCGHGS